MAYPNDIFLPPNAKSFGFIDTKLAYNINWDLNWSFSFALTGTEHGFCTFLTTNPNSLSGNPGQYMGYLQKNYIYDDFILYSENSDIILDEENQPILYDISNYGYNNILAIAFDSTGMFALSSGGNPGIPGSQLKRNSITIRNHLNDIIFYESLSSLSTEFFLSSSIPNFQTLRFRLSYNGRKLSIEYRNSDHMDYTALTSILITLPINNNTLAYPGFSFCSPISSLNQPSTMFLKNFHVQGNTALPTYYNIPLSPLTTTIPTEYTILSGISATPIL